MRQSLGYAQRNVKIVATNAGVEILGDGPSHQGVEDLAIMRTIAGLTVLSPSDPVTTKLAVETIAASEGPVYMRLGRQPAAYIHDDGVDFRIGKMIRLREGGDVTIIATGHMVEQALLAAETLAGQGVEARVLDCHTIKPIDREAILAAAEETRAIVTVEDHSVIGGLGGAVCEVVADGPPHDRKARGAERSIRQLRTRLSQADEALRPRRGSGGRCGQSGAWLALP